MISITLNDRNTKHGLLILFFLNVVQVDQWS